MSNGSVDLAIRPIHPHVTAGELEHGLGVGVTNALAVATANLDAIRAVPPPTWPVAPA